MEESFRSLVEAAMGEPVERAGALSGGCVGEVYRVDLVSGARVVAKLDRSATGSLPIEAGMLRYLAEHTRLPVPRVLHDEASVLLMEYIESDGRGGKPGETHTADLLAHLHSFQPVPPRDGGAGFGFGSDTLIGGLDQANPWTESWIEFFAQHRLLNMARQAHDAGRIDTDLLRRVERFTDKLASLIDEPEAPALIHGDVWGGNILFHSGKVAAFIDPAIYFAHPEIELAFTTLFSTFSPAFYERYNDLRPIAPGFFEQRRDIYNLYPLLAHSRLFGGSYVSQVSRTLTRFGA